MIALDNAMFTYDGFRVVIGIASIIYLAAIIMIGWEYKQRPRARILVYVVPLLLGCAVNALLAVNKPFSLMIAAFPLQAVANWITVALTAILLVQLLRAGESASSARRFGSIVVIAGLVLLTAGFGIIIAYWVRVAEAYAENPETYRPPHPMPSTDRLLRIVGYALTLAAEVAFSATAFWLLSSISPQSADKDQLAVRKQALLFSLQFIAMIMADVSVLIQLPFTVIVAYFAFHYVTCYTKGVHTYESDGSRQQKNWSDARALFPGW